ncbi:hypothetical protein EDB84DRAFT_1496080 [Lactarius hengduanensis]|nr:hypothetical protein EDB84DRAFT_1496080 [Lactarius hengduanensis]
MATAQDVEHRKCLDPPPQPGPSAPQISGRGTQIAESQGSPSQLRVETVHWNQTSALFPPTSSHYILYYIFMRNGLHPDTVIGTHQILIPPNPKVVLLTKGDNSTDEEPTKPTPAVSRIKRVMDTVSPIAELHPFAKMAYGLVSAIPGHETLKLESIKPDSRQAKILTTMLRDDEQFCTLSSSSL